MGLKSELKKTPEAMFVPAFLQSQLYDVFVGDCGEADLNLKGPSAAQTPAFPQAATETHHSFP